MSESFACPQCGGTLFSESKCTACGHNISTPRPKGFAAMPRDAVRAIAKKGGVAAHQAGTAHEFTTEEARIAGQKGGRASHANRRAAKGSVA